MSGRPHLKKAAAMATAVGLAVTVAACGGIVDKRGYVRDEVAFESVQVGVDNKESVYQRLGSPSTMASISDDKWYYISSREKRMAFFAPEIEERQITAIVFDENDMVAEVENYGLEDGKVVSYVDRKTPTRGKELTFLEQMFGNIGRLPAPGQNKGGQE